MIPFIENLRELKLIYNDIKQNSAFLGMMELRDYNDAPGNFWHMYM